MSRVIAALLHGALFLSGVSAAVSASSQPLIASQFPARVLAAHNIERAMVGVPPMSWDNALGTSAALYAQQMALTGITTHSDRRTRPGVGENLWWGTHNGFSVEQMVGAWASEKRMFVPGIFPNNSRTGNWLDVSHYSVMIWPTTTRVGCALASNGRNEYLVCHYAPKGNIDGKWVGRRSGERG